MKQSVGVARLTARAVGMIAPDARAQAALPGVTKTPLGKAPDQQAVQRSAKGAQVSVISHHGAVGSFIIPDRNGCLARGSDKLHDYLRADTYFGARVGRCANLRRLSIQAAA